MGCYGWAIVIAAALLYGALIWALQAAGMLPS